MQQANNQEILVSQIMHKLTTYFYAPPSFVEGVARLFDFSGSLNTYNYSENSAQDDLRVLESDWMAVGDDLRSAIEQLRQQEKVVIDDALVSEARNELMKDRTMQLLLSQC